MAGASTISSRQKTRQRPSPVGSKTSSGGAAIFLALGCLAAKMFAPPGAGSSPRDAVGSAPQWQGGDGVSLHLCVDQKNRFQIRELEEHVDNRKRPFKKQTPPPLRAGM